MLVKLRNCYPRLQGIQLLPNESTLASALDTVHNRMVLLKELSLDSGAHTVYNHLRCQRLGLPAPTLYHFHNFNDTVVTECGYAPGKDLFYQLHDSRVDLPVMSIMKQLLSHVESYQKHNLSHLDIKLENIVWDDQAERLHIIDFEYMRVHATAGLVSLETPLGTADYMSPEVLYESKVHRNTDLWNVGLVGYALVMKRIPLCHGETDRRDLQRYVRRELDDAGVDDALSLLITSLLHFNPEYRSACYVLLFLFSVTTETLFCNSNMRYLM